MRNILVSLVVGLLFGLGLMVSGMTRPEIILGFLTLDSSWDPSAMVVMGGAAAVYFVAHSRVKGLGAPLFGGKFALPTRTDIDARLIGGAALFGVGWGLSGYCPGPVLTSVAGGGLPVLVLLGSMVAGMGLFHVVDQRLNTDR